MFHQPANTFGNNIYNAFVYSGSGYDTHFHRSFELLVCLSGKTDLTIGDFSAEIGEGEGAIVFPYRPHSFRTPEDSELFVLVFSGDSLPALGEVAKKKLPSDPRLRFESHEYAFLSETLFHVKEKPDDFTYAAALNVVGAAVTRIRGFADREAREETVLKVIDFVENNFKEDITLADAAKELGYNYQYLSRMFGRVMKMNFRELVNQYRYDNAASLLSEGRTVTDAAFDSGFGSVRNFYRVKAEMESLPE